MEAMIRTDEENCRSSYLGLIGMLVGVIVGAFALYATGGAPHLPAQLPNWKVVSATLHGSSLPLRVVAYILSTAAWAVWLWIVASLMLRVAVLASDAVTHGAAWVATLRAVSDRVTLPIVRRAVDGALVTVFVVNIASRTVSGAAAASLPAVSTPHVSAPRSHASLSASHPAARNGQTPRDITYTVQAGDTLWDIAQRFYGTGYEFPRLVTANVGRHMTDRERFTAAGVIQPGWNLRIPLPSGIVSEKNDVHYYVVEEGDSLQGIAARLLGSEEKWRVLFEANRGAAQLDGHVLADPDLIWPGLRLKLPSVAPHIATHLSAAAVHHPGPSTDKPRKAPPRRRLSPIPVEPMPTSIPTRPTATPVATPTPATAKDPSTPISVYETDMLIGAAGVASVAAVGGAVLLARRRVRRSLDDPPIPSPSRRWSPDEFTEVDPARALSHRLNSGEIEPIILLVDEVRRCLVDSEIVDSSVLWAQQGRKMVTLVLRVPPRDRERVLALVKDLGSRLGGKARASLTGDHDVVLQLSSPSLASLPVQRHRDNSNRTHLVPLGVLPDDQTLYGNWDEFGHVLLAGLPSGGTDVILTSLIVSLAARRHPDELRLVTIADPHMLPAQLSSLPHHADDFIDATDEARVSETLESLRGELLQRMRRAEPQEGSRWRASPEEPAIVLIVGELGDLPDQGTTLELIGTQGGAHEIRLLAQTAVADTLAADVLTHFETRVVLQTRDDDESILLIGQPGAADLADGELYLRIDGRMPLRLRGYRVSPEHLDELANLMCEVYGDPPVISPFVAQTDRKKDGDTQVSDGEEMLSGTQTAHINMGRVGFEKGQDESEGSRCLVSEIATEHQLPHENGRDTLVQAPKVEGLPDLPLIEAVETSNGHQHALDAALTEQGLAPAPGIDQVPAPLIEVRCFGGFAVTSGVQEISPTGEEGASYKAWEVLAFLASQPEGAVAKEKILAAIWPDVDEERAGTRLRTALKRLRALLAEQVPNVKGDVVRSGRDGIRRLDTTVVSSDAHQFISLLSDSGKLPSNEAKAVLRQARKLYQGDLLSGRGARLYEWVEERDGSGVTLREYYREEYYRATQRLARLHYGEGHAELAVPLYKELLKVEPTLEDVVRELYLCYQQLGDLQSLIREDRHLRQALRDAYAEFDAAEIDTTDVQPEPETTTLFKAIRGELEINRALSTEG